MADPREIKIVIRAEDDYSAAMKKVNAELNGLGLSAGSSAQKMESSWKNGLMGIQTAWLQLAGVVASATWLIDAGRDALAAEKNFNRLDIQLRNMGYSYNAIVEDAVKASARYAHVQEEAVARTLQELIFTTDNYQKSIENLNLTYDLAYLKGIDASESAALIGKAITGNIDMLGRYMVEFKNLDDKLGKNATASDRAAYAIAVFREKVEGARLHMTEHEKRVEELTNAYRDLKQSVGDFALFMATDFLRSLEGPSKLIDMLVSAYHALTPYDTMTQKMAKDYLDMSSAVGLVGSAHQKTAEQIAQGSKARSDAFDVTKKATEGAASYAAFMAKIQMEEDKFWADREIKLNALRDKAIAANAAKLDKERETALEYSMTKIINANMSDIEDIHTTHYIQNLDRKHQAEIDYFMNRLNIADVSFSALNGIEELYEFRAQSRLRIREAAYKGMETQMLRLVETGKFSVGAMAQVIAQQVKMELVGLAARATVWAIYETAMGLKDLVVNPPAAALHFASALEFGSVAGASMAAAAGVQALFGGRAQPSAPGSPTGEPIRTEPVPQSFSSPDARPSQSITVIIQNGMGDAAYWEKITQDNIIPAINSAADRDVNIVVRTQ